MKYLYVIIPLIIIFIGIYIKIKINEKKLKEEAISLFHHYGSYNDENHTITIDEETYQIVFFKVPGFGELTINSLKIWELNGRGGQKLFYMDKYLSSPLKKIIIVYPNVAPIKRYINENEMVFVKHSFFNKMYVIRYPELKDFLNKLGETNEI